ncbi:MAG: DUF3473 domain-containing protein [Deltaproteobacteria bacterium]|nr:DUF3473 domain-containing protein [Deltaproteobacteria bacterium]
MKDGHKSNFLSIDVEDYFQVSAFEDISPRNSWDGFEPRVEANTDRVLRCLSDASVKGTFFILGWVAERFPALIRRIAEEGHEVACHGLNHERLTGISRESFRRDIRRGKKLLENLTGRPVWGFRAPSFSISPDTLWAFDELLEAGYRYDSSVFPIKHDFYGLPDWPDSPFWVKSLGDGQWVPDLFSGAVEDFSNIPAAGRVLEIPIPTLKLLGRKWPIAGGGYFRLYPYFLTRWGLRHINEAEGKAFVFYVHPWEFDPQQPVMKGARLKSRVRHYLNLDKTESRFRSLLKDFSFGRICDMLPPP